ncbi:MAG TPA: CHASE4 domain-containing protein, partial [Terriglobales bacterium]|nr:CHASE4 domain-containing protein [Terriglobales bacterium]
MTIQRKTFSILAVTIVSLMMLLYFAAQVFVMRSFNDLEREQAQLTVERVRNELFHDSLSSLTATANDYGAWDRMYEFMSAPAPSYKPIAEEFQDGTLQGLRINSVLVTDLSGHVVFSKIYDFHQHSSTNMMRETQRSLASDPWVRRVISSSTHASGVTLQANNTVLIAACPITTTEHRGPVRGVIVMTRDLDSQALMDLQTVTQTHLSLGVLTDHDLPADFQWARQQFQKNAELFPVQTLDSNTISSYVLLRDIHGDPAVILRADGDRRISQSGLVGIRYFIVALCFLGLSFAFVTWLLLHTSVLSRLAQLHEQVAQITAQHWTAKHVQIRGRDEISDLGSAINSMLDIVRSTETKLDLLANNIHQVFWVKDADTLRFSYISSGYQKLWGQSCESLYADPSSWIRAVLPEDRKVAEKILNQQKHGETGEGEFRIVGADGRTCWIWTRFFPVTDTSGKVQQYVGIVEDIT